MTNIDPSSDEAYAWPSAWASPPKLPDLRQVQDRINASLARVARIGRDLSFPRQEPSLADQEIPARGQE